MSYRCYSSAKHAAEELLRQVRNIAKHDTILVASDGATFVLYLHRLDDKWLLTVRFWTDFIPHPVLQEMRSGVKVSTLSRRINYAVRELQTVAALQEIGR